MQIDTKKPFVAILRRAFWSGSTASILSALTVAWRGHAERVGALRGINAVSHWRWGDRALQQTKLSLRYTLPALLVHHASSVFWAAFYEYFLKRGSRKTYKSSVTNPSPNELEDERISEDGLSTKKVLTYAAGVTALAWFVDFHLTPKRLTPGFERVISKPSLIATYTAFGCGLGAIGLWAAYQKKHSMKSAPSKVGARDMKTYNATKSSKKLPEQEIFSEALNGKNAKVTPADWMPPLP